MVFLQPVHQVPDSCFVPLMPVHHAVVIEHLDLIQQLHQPFPDLRMAQHILKNIAAESSHTRIRRQAHHHTAQERNLLRLCCRFFRQRVQAEIMPAFLRNLPVGDLVLVWKKNTELGLFHHSVLFQRFVLS